MGTKSNPGAYDCHAAAGQDEPLFTLLGRDPLAGLLVRLWAELRAIRGDDDAQKVAEARELARALDDWARQEGKAPAWENDPDLRGDAVCFALERIDARDDSDPSEPPTG